MTFDCYCMQFMHPLAANTLYAYYFYTSKLYTHMYLCKYIQTFSAAYIYNYKYPLLFTYTILNTYSRLFVNKCIFLLISVLNR